MHAVCVYVRGVLLRACACRERKRGGLALVPPGLQALSRAPCVPERSRVGAVVGGWVRERKGPGTPVRPRFTKHPSRAGDLPCPPRVHRHPSQVEGKAACPLRDPGRLQMPLGLLSQPCKHLAA